ncbi:MAG: hypothetical protein K0R12_346 [Gammaproteobacteria bacterium]|jgi:zinc transporter 1/2/3|nr:hypothetical protein [Gammaproteobacteria bacterium]
MINWIMAILVFIVALAGAVWPLWMDSRDAERNWLIDGEAFARGIFLSAAVIHMLPSAEHDFALAAGNSHYPYTFVIAVLTVFLMALLRQVALRICQHKSTSIHHHWQPYLLMLVLCIHSLIVGGALGNTPALASFIVLSIAVLAHKGAEGFALSTNMQNCQLSIAHIWRLIIAFALMTPMGMIAGHFMQMDAATLNAHITLAVFNAVAAGTFLYVATDEVLSNNVGKSSVTSVCYFGAGIILMAVVAIVL